MSRAARAVPRYTFEEYDSLDRGPHGERFEYLNGEIIAIVGGTRAYNRIISNLHALLEKALIHSPCEVYRETFRLHIRTADDEARFYLDLFVNCDPPPYSATEASDATLVVEVSSPSTIDYDRETKLPHYLQFVPSLREVVLVEYDRPLVRVYRHDMSHTRHELTNDITLAGLDDRTIAVRDIYAGIEFA